MIWKHGLFAGENADAFKIVDVKKVRRSYEIVGEGEPLPFIADADINNLGISKREVLPVEDDFSGTLYSLSQMDISKLIRINKEAEPKKWSRFLGQYVRRITLFQSTSAFMPFRSDEDELAPFFAITKSANNKVDSPHFRDGKIILPAVGNSDKSNAYLIIDIPNRLLMAWDESGRGDKRKLKNVEKVELGLGRIGQFKHLKWPRPNRDGQKSVDSCLIWTVGIPD